AVRDDPDRARVGRDQLWGLRRRAAAAVGTTHQLAARTSVHFDLKVNPDRIESSVRSEGADPNRRWSASCLLLTNLGRADSSVPPVCRFQNDTSKVAELITCPPVAPVTTSGSRFASYRP